MTSPLDPIDLRSDTVTRPGPEMRAAMASANVGDDVWGDDPTVTALEEKTAALLGHERALFVPSGTQSNLCALLSHCERGEEYIVGQNAHTYKYEAGGAAVLGSIQPQPIEFADNGTLDLELVAAKIKIDDPHFARTRLLALEDTQDGKALPLDYLQEAVDFAEQKGLSTHLDGARIWNAAAAQDVEVETITSLFDSVSVCLSKGLGAPIGSVLAGSDELIGRAHRWRKMLGGGLRQAGIIAAAGIYALDHHRARLVDDHEMAVAISEVLKEIDGVDVRAVNTNMVFADFSAYSHSSGRNVGEQLAEHQILGPVGPASGRIVTHLDLPADTPQRLAQALA